MQIADAVLTLSTDDAPLRAGLAAAESRIRDALRRMESVIRQTGVGIDAGTAVAVQSALAALTGLNTALAANAARSVLSTVALIAYSSAVRESGAAGLRAARDLRIAIAIIRAAIADIAAQARAAAASAAAAFASAAASRSTMPTPALRQFSALPLTPNGSDAPSALNLRGAPIVGNLNVTIDREHPRAVQDGIEQAFIELASRADLAGALD